MNFLTSNIKGINTKESEVLSEIEKFKLNQSVPAATKKNSIVPKPDF